MSRKIEHLTNVNAKQADKLRNLDGQKHESSSNLGGMQERLQLLTTRLAAMNQLNKVTKEKSQGQIKELEQRIVELTDYIARKEADTKRRRKAKPLPA